MPNSCRIHQPRLPHQLQDAALGVVLQAVRRLEQPAKETTLVILAPFEIQQEKHAARCKNPAHLAQHCLSRIHWKVMEHERRKYAIERRRGIWQCVRNP